MSAKHARRHRKARMIRAAAKVEHPILCESATINWIQAEAGDQADKPKRFAMLAYTGGPMLVANYGVPVAIDLQGLQAADTLPILLAHDHTAIVGHADKVDVQATQIKLSGAISGVGPAAEEVKATAKNGFPWKASVGVRPDKLEFVGEDIATKVNGKSYRGPLYVARKSTLQEVSFVAVAADSRTSAQVAATAAKQQERIMDPKFQAWIEAMGLVVAELRDDQVAKLQAKYDGEIKASAKDGKTIEAAVPTFDLRNVTMVYERHVATVQAKAATFTGKIEPAMLSDIRAKAEQKAAELKLQAMNEEWPAVKLEVALVKAQADAEVELIRAERPKGPAIHASTKDYSPQVIEAAFARSCGVQIDKHYKPEVLEAADRSYRSFGLQEAILACANAAGYSGRQRITAGNIREVIQAGFSTHTLTTLLTSTGNKILLDGFNSMPQSWREVAQVRTVNDFKTMTAYRMTATLEYQELAPDGEIQHGTLGQETYTYAAKTYARMLALTRTDIINDDLGAFNDVRNRLGMGAAIKMNKVFWTAWLAASNGAAFWTSARANLVTSSALAEAGLNTAVAAFRDLAGPDGNMMNLEPVKLLVPSALEATARKLYTSQEVRDTTSSTKYLVANIYQNRFMPVVVPELGNSSYTGYSATTWFLLCDPAILASAVMCFLNGQQSPTIESADADFNTLGIEFRGYHDFGVAMTEYRASVKATA